MPTTSWVQIMDNAFKTMIYNRFGPILGATSSNSDITFAPKEAALRFIAEKRGANTTEFLSVWRDGMAFDWDRQNTPIARKGLTMDYTASSAGGSRSSLITIKAVPATIDYKFYVWSRDLDKTAQAAESYLKWLHDSPNMKIFYNGLYEMDCYLKFGKSQDVTDYSIWDKGKNFVFEFPVTMDGWIMTSVTCPAILRIIIDVYLREGASPHFRDTLINEYIVEAS